MQHARPEDHARLQSWLGACGCAEAEGDEKLTSSVYSFLRQFDDVMPPLLAAYSAKLLGRRRRALGSGQLEELPQRVVLHRLAEGVKVL